MRLGVSALLLLLAGCAAPAFPPDDAASGHDARLPSSLDVDLHEHVLNITMPEGQPTMLVALNVTEESWVRPHLGAPAPGGYRKVSATADTYWALCPWVKSTGLADGFHYVVLPFWLESSSLVAAAPFLPMWWSRDADGGACVSGTSWNNQDAAISADAPHAGTLVLLIAVAPDETAGAQAGDPPPFEFTVGLGTRVCPDDDTAWCPPDAAVPAEPIARASLGLAAVWDTYEGSEACDECGFQIEDARTRVGTALEVGSLRLTREGSVERGVTMALAGSALRPGGGPPGRSALTARLSSDEILIESTCADDQGNHAIAFVAPHRYPISFTAEYDLLGSRGFRAETLEIPVDVTALGWVVQRYAGLAWGATGQANMCAEDA